MFSVSLRSLSYHLFLYQLFLLSLVFGSIFFDVVCVVGFISVARWIGVTVDWRCNMMKADTVRSLCTVRLAPLSSLALPFQ